MLDILFLLSWFRRDAFALKWFFPGVRVKNLPALVTLILFANDLFVFMFVLLRLFVFTVFDLLLWSPFVLGLCLLFR